MVPLSVLLLHPSLSHTLLLDAGHVLLLYAQLEYLDSWLRRAELLFGIEYRRRSSKNGFPATASLWTTLQIGGPADLGACTPKP